MFEHLIKVLWEKRLNREQLAFDKTKETHGVDIYGKWVDGKRVYSNGCYCVPFEKIDDEWKVKLCTKNGKEIRECRMSEIHNWHHEFIMVRLRFSTIKEFYDCDGNMIFDGAGVFITDKEELGENLYLIPLQHCDTFILYNHKTRKFVSDSACNADYLVFDGVKGKDGEILGVKSGMCDSAGYGTCNDTTYYDRVYVIDYNGNIRDRYRENYRKENYGKQMEEDSDA